MDMMETIIIEMAAENPPKNTKTVRALLSKNCGINRNRYLHSDLQKDVAAPSNWEDENIKSNKYNGKASAVRICFRIFNNCSMKLSGKRKIANIDKTQKKPVRLTDSQ
jgi:hypothetical protein